MKSPGLPGLKMVQARISLQRARWPATSATTGRRLYASAPAESPAPLELANIRRSLILMEDTIIFSLIERSQYALNLPVYQPGATVQQYMKDNGRQLSLLEYLLMETVRDTTRDGDWSTYRRRQDCYGYGRPRPSHPSRSRSRSLLHTGARPRQDPAVQLVGGKRLLPELSPAADPPAASEPGGGSAVPGGERGEREQCHHGYVPRAPAAGHLRDGRRRAVRELGNVRRDDPAGALEADSLREVRGGEQVQEANGGIYRVDPAGRRRRHHGAVDRSGGRAQGD